MDPESVAVAGKVRSKSGNWAMSRVTLRDGGQIAPPGVTRHWRQQVVVTNPGRGRGGELSDGTVCASVAPALSGSSRVTGAKSVRTENGERGRKEGKPSITNELPNLMLLWPIMGCQCRHNV